jgi:hypothetical protein
MASTQVNTAVSIAANTMRRAIQEWMVAAAIGRAFRRAPLTGTTDYSIILSGKAIAPRLMRSRRTLGQDGKRECVLLVSKQNKKPPEGALYSSDPGLRDQTVRSMVVLLHRR